MTFEELLAAARELAARPGITDYVLHRAIADLLSDLRLPDLASLVGSCNKLDLSPTDDWYFLVLAVRGALTRACNERVENLTPLELVRRVTTHDMGLLRTANSWPLVAEAYMSNACIDRLYDLCEEHMGEEAYGAFLDSMSGTHELPPVTANRLNFARVCEVLGLSPDA